MKEKLNNTSFIEIVYNGEKISLSYEDVIKLTQKGMNYDKLYEKLNKMMEENKKLKGKNEKLEKIAEGLKLSSDDLLNGLETEREKENILEFSKENNVPYEYAKLFKEMEEKIKSLEKEKEELVPIKRKNEEILDFKKSYPDVDERTLDPEILSKWEETKRPLKDIYNEITLKKLLEERTIKKANDENNNASTGSVLGVSEKEEEFTDEMIRNMSDKEFNRNFSKILKQLKKGDR